MSEHVALLGDSIFDNAAYTEGEPDVVSHLRMIVPDRCAFSLLARDGSTTGDLDRQLAALPSGVTRLVISIGGNDALLNADILGLPVSSTHDALLLFGERAIRFEQNYRSAILAAVQRVRRVTVCTIYNGNLPDDQAPTARVALMLFNDVILRVAFELSLDVIDLRLVCVQSSDYANPIEPSGQGGRKIAGAIARALGLLSETKPTSRVHG
jgi:hypothetical protein